MLLYLSAVVKEVIEEFKSITDTFRLCYCLEVSLFDCKTIHNTWGKEDTKNLIMDIANSWYQKSIEHLWEEIVTALICMQKISEANSLAKKKGIPTVY